MFTRLFYGLGLALQILFWAAIVIALFACLKPGALMDFEYVAF